MTLLNWSHVYNNEKIIKRSYSVDPYLQLLWLIPLGFFAGGYGTLTSRKRYKKASESEWVSPDRWRWCEHRLRFYLQLLRDRRRFSLRACAGVSATLPNSYRHRDSLFVLTITAFTGSVTHVAAGLFQHGFRRVIALSIGAIIGAQLAARFSRRIRGEWIIRSLAAALGLVGLRLVAAVFE